MSGQEKCAKCSKSQVLTVWFLAPVLSCMPSVSQHDQISSDWSRFFFFMCYAKIRMIHWPCFKTGVHLVHRCVCLCECVFLCGEQLFSTHSFIWPIIFTSLRARGHICDYSHRARMWYFYTWLLSQH